MGEVQVHERLRRAREGRGLGLSAIEQRTKVPRRQLECLESGRFDELPRGVYARAMIRSYAGAVGLDPESVVEEVLSLLPAIEDPLDGLARVRGLERVTPKNAAPADTSVPVPATSAARRCLATAIDSALLAGVDLVILGSSARACALSVDQLLEFAAPTLVMLWGLIAGLYFVILAGIGGATPGTRLAGTMVTSDGPCRPVGARSAGIRAWRFALREGSILVDLLIGTERGQQCLHAMRLGASPRRGARS